MSSSSSTDGVWEIERKMRRVLQSAAALCPSGEEPFSPCSAQPGSAVLGLAGVSAQIARQEPRTRYFGERDLALSWRSATWSRRRQTAGRSGAYSTGWPSACALLRTRSSRMRTVIDCGGSPISAAVAR